jgi:metal-responsive CopG/Arc/MetJ family transcriptional regulator
MKRRVEVRFEEGLLESVDRAATLLNMTRTEFVKHACKTYLLSIRQNRKYLKAPV